MLYIYNLIYFSYAPWYCPKTKIEEGDSRI